MLQSQRVRRSLHCYQISPHDQGFPALSTFQTQRAQAEHVLASSHIKFRPTLAIGIKLLISTDD